MADMAVQAAAQGPRGFSLESISTALGPCGMRWRAAAANAGSLNPRKAAAADAAAERCRKDRREKRGIGTSAKECIRVGSFKRSKTKAKDRNVKSHSFR